MAAAHTPWLRLWAEMPNDPKWKTISRASGSSIAEVIAVYLHLLVNASNATERGRTQNVRSEDIASALDIESAKVEEIMGAMQGRVLDGDKLSGWAKRQPMREDGSSERGKAFRERQRAEKERERTGPNATERKQTQTIARGEERREEKINTGGARACAPAPAGAPSLLSGKYLEVIKAERPELPNPEAIYANFCDLSPPAKRTLARWKVWVRKEHASKEQPPSKSDPNSRASIEAQGIAAGLGSWNEMEQWAVYAARVQTAQGMPA